MNYFRNALQRMTFFSPKAFRGKEAATPRSQSRTPSGRAPSFRPSLEALEDRQLLSVTASLSDGLLSVAGDAVGDSMVVRQANNQITVVGTEYSFAADAVTSVNVQGLAGNHVIDVRGVSKPSTLSGPGNDQFLIDLTSPVTLPAYNATDRIEFSDPVPVQRYSVRTDGSVWALRRDGLLYGNGQLIDSGVLSFDITPHGVVYELNAMQGGVLLNSATGNPGTFQQIGPGNTRAFAMAPDGTAYALSLDGVLRRNQGADGGNCDIVVDSGVLAFAISPYGVVYELNAMQGGVLLNSGTGNPGTFQQIGPGNTRAFAMAPDGTAYALSADGVLRRNGGGLGGNCTEVVDTGVLQVAISPAGVVTELNAMQGGVLLNSGTGNPGTFQQIGPGNTRAFAMAPIGTIYALGADGVLRRNGPLGGNCLEVVDTGVLQVTISPAGVVTELNAMQGGVLLNGWGGAGGFQQIGPGNTRAFAMAPIGTIYALGADSILRRNGPLGGNCLEWVDSGVLQVAISPAGVVYELNAMQGGVLLNGWGGAGGFQQIGPGNTRAFAMAPIGTAYALGADSVLRRNGGGFGGNCLEVVDTGVLQVAVSPAGVVTELNAMQGGVLLNGWGNPGGFQQIGPGNTRAFAMAPIGTIYALGADGVLRRNGPLGGNCLEWVDSGVLQVAVSPAGVVYELNAMQGGVLLNGWGGAGGFQQIGPGITRAFAMAPIGTAYALGADGILRHNQGAFGGNCTEVVDRLVYSFSLGLDGSIALDDWFNRNLNDPGLQILARMDFTRDASVSRNDMLGLFAQAEADGVVTGAELHDLQVLAANAGLLQMPAYVQYLASRVANGDPANAHYQGQTLGNLYAGSPAWQLQDLVNKWFLGLDHPTAGVAYNPGTGVLFSGSPSYQDVFQGALGDCTVLASVAGVAARTNLINSMFIDNGDGTWTVRFYNNGFPVYVTVDNQLPGSGNLYDHPSNGVLWVALAEKAYAQLNESGWLATLSPGINSYLALDNGNVNTIVTALSALTGRSGSTFSTSSADIGTALSQGRLVVLGTGNNTGHANIEHNHAYAVVGYDPSQSLPFTLFNPWGINGGYDGPNFIWGQFTANAAALQAYFYGGGWTGERARTSLAEDVPVTAIQAVSRPGQRVTARAEDGASDHAQLLAAPSIDWTAMARGVVGAERADAASSHSSKPAQHRCESDVARLWADQVIDDVVLALMGKEEGGT
jgi:hypothetical protein